MCCLVVVANQARLTNWGFFWPVLDAALLRKEQQTELDAHGETFIQGLWLIIINTGMALLTSQDPGRQLVRCVLLCVVDESVRASRSAWAIAIVRAARSAIPESISSVLSTYPSACRHKNITSDGERIIVRDILVVMFCSPNPHIGSKLQV